MSNDRIKKQHNVLPTTFTEMWQRGKEISNKTEQRTYNFLKQGGAPSYSNIRSFSCFINTYTSCCKEEKQIHNDYLRMFI
jgi:hypothetical protein